MRRIEFSGRLEEASYGVRGKLLNRGSQVRILSPAPGPNFYWPGVRSSGSTLAKFGNLRQNRITTFCGIESSSTCLLVVVCYLPCNSKL